MESNDTDSQIAPYLLRRDLCLTAHCWLRSWASVQEAPLLQRDGGYTATPLSTTSSTTNVAGGEAQQFVEARDIPGEWWTLFHSKPLSDLIERSLKANPDIKAAQAALLVARENVWLNGVLTIPALREVFRRAGPRHRVTLRLFPTPTRLNYSLYTPQVSVSYVPDVFGLNRRTVESLRSAGTTGAFCPGRDAYHVERKRRRRSHTRGIIAGADWRDS
jgi:outer membrane protein TolC